MLLIPPVLAPPLRMVTIVSGEVTFTAANIISSLPMVKSARLRALAVTGEQRSPVLPQVPTVAETLPGYAAGPFYGVLAPGGMSAELSAPIAAHIAVIRLASSSAHA